MFYLARPTNKKGSGMRKTNFDVSNTDFHIHIRYIAGGTDQ